jgi:hypothetical protein
MLASLSIDLDGLAHYHHIHGLPDPPPGADPVYGAAVERFGELCSRLGLAGTVFCVGRDLEDEPASRAAVRRLAEAGHELANHTLSHDYALTRRPRPEIAAEVRGGGDAIAAVAGRRPVGFRAPGYTLSADLMAVLAEQGYRYDASAFPALPYYAAKAAVLAGMKLAGRRSGAVLDRPRALAAPRVPYFPAASEPYAVGASPVLELPVATGLLGFPIIGTFVGALPPAVVAGLALGAKRRPHLNLELHGIDLLDASDAPPALAARQRDLRTPAAVKIARIEAFVRRLGGRPWLPLAEVAQRLERAALRRE